MDDDEDDNMCHACGGSGGGDYPCACQSCGGSGQRRRLSRRDEDGEEPDNWGDFSDNNAEVRW